MHTHLHGESIGKKISFLRYVIIRYLDTAFPFVDEAIAQHTILSEDRSRRQHRDESSWHAAFNLIQFNTFLCVYENFHGTGFLMEK